MRTTTYLDLLATKYQKGRPLPAHLARADEVIE
jgi:hypothetical protein